MSFDDILHLRKRKTNITTRISCGSRDIAHYSRYNVDSCIQISSENNSIYITTISYKEDFMKQSYVVSVHLYILFMIYSIILLMHFNSVFLSQV